MKIFYQKTSNDCAEAILKTFFYYFYDNCWWNIPKPLLRYKTNGISLANFEELLKINLLKCCFFQIVNFQSFRSTTPFAFLYYRHRYWHFYLVTAIINTNWLVSNMNHRPIVLGCEWFHEQSDSLLFIQIMKR